MSNIHDRIREDDVSGEIVGGLYVVGALFYDGKKQSKYFYASTEESLKSQSEEFVSGKKSEFGELFKSIWPRDSWELRIF